MTNWLLIMVALVSLNTISFGQCSEPSWTTSAYSGGAKVSYEGKIYKAKWWTQNQTPGTNNVWEYVEDCSNTVTPIVEISSPTHEQEILHDGQSISLPIIVDVNDDEITIDSVFYTIVDIYNGGGAIPSYQTGYRDSSVNPFTVYFRPALDAALTQIQAVAYSNGQASEKDVHNVRMKRVHQAIIKNLVSGQTYEVDPTNAFYDVEVEVNQAIDSVVYVITDVNQFNQGNTRSITVATAPYTCNMPVILGGNYTIVRAIPYKNGSQGKHLPAQVTFIEKAQETLQATIITPEHGDTIYLPENNPRIDVEVSLNQEVDSVLYAITEVDERNFGATRTFVVKEAPYTLDYDNIYFGAYAIIRAIPFKDGSQGIIDENTVHFKKQQTEELSATIISPANNSTIYLPTTNPTMDLNVDVTGDADSVQFVVTDLYGQNGGSRYFTKTSAPYVLTFDVQFSNATNLHAIPFKNGVAGTPAVHRVYFKKDVAPTVSIVSPADQETIVVNPGGTITVTPSLSGSEVAADSILYIIVDAFASSGNVRRFTKRYPQPTSLTFEATPTASYTEIHVIAFGNGGRPSAEVTHDIYVEAKPTIEFTTTEDIAYNAENPETSFITVNTNDVDGNVIGVHYRVTDGYGTFTYNTLASPFTMDYTPRIAGDLTIHAIATDNDGHFSDTTTYVFNVVEESACSLPEWNASSSYSGGSEVQYQGVSYKAKWWTNANPTNGSPWEITTTCGSSSRVLGVTETQNTSLDVYPNPTSGIFTLAIDIVDAVSVQVINAQGELVVAAEEITSSTEFDLSNQASGVYFVRVISNNEVRTQKVIVE